MLYRSTHLEAIQCYSIIFWGLLLAFGRKAIRWWLPAKKVGGSETTVSCTVAFHVGEAVEQACCCLAFGSLQHVCALTAVDTICCMLVSPHLPGHHFQLAVSFFFAIQVILQADPSTSIQNSSLLFKPTVYIYVGFGSVSSAVSTCEITPKFIS